VEAGMSEKKPRYVKVTKGTKALSEMTPKEQLQWVKLLTVMGMGGDEMIVFVDQTERMLHLKPIEVQDVIDLLKDYIRAEIISRRGNGKPA
jgi:phosphoribosyl-dephospho-CoA transferase